MNEQNILRSLMRCAPLPEAHGLRYINLDAAGVATTINMGQLGTRLRFPHFLDMIQHIHANGQKVGDLSAPRNWHLGCFSKSAYFRYAVSCSGHRMMPLTIGNGFGYVTRSISPSRRAGVHNSIVNLYASWASISSSDSVTWL